MQPAKSYSVYMITNVVNGKKYVGLTSQSILTRWKQHVGAAKCGVSMPLCRAIKRYGEAAFVVEHMACSVSASDMYATEILIIAQEKTTERAIGYNASTGGEFGSTGAPKSDKFKAHQSEIKRGNKHALGALRSAETRSKMSAAQKGHPVSQEQRAKISATLRANPQIIERLRQYNERFHGGRQLKLFAPGTLY